MARAFVTDIGKIEVNAGTPKIQAEVIYGGVDVAGTYQNKGIMVDVTGVTDAAGLLSAVAAAVRAHATTNGWTVAANQVFLPSYTTG